MRGVAMIELAPNALYTSTELEDLIGRATLAQLRKAGGLRAVGDRYLGQLVLDAYRQAAQAKALSIQRVPSVRKEVQHEDTQEKDMAKDRQNGRAFGVPTSNQPTPLRSQLQKARRSLRKA